MKIYQSISKKDICILVAVIAYSFLFYQQRAGLNFLLFAILIVGLLYSQTRADQRKQPSWYVTAAASILTGISIVVTGSELAIALNIASVLLLAAFSLSPRSSIFVAAANALYSCASAFISFSIKTYNSKEQKAGGLILAGVQRQHIFMIGIPVAVTTVFLVIYASASSAFSYVLSQFEISFISIEWLVFTMIGFVLLFGIFYQKLIPIITETDLAAGNTLTRIRVTRKRGFKLPELRYEYKTSVLLLVLLNLLLLFFILSDAYYLTIGTLPESVAYSDFLHQGVYGLIFSILLAMAVLLYVFRGNLNFISNSKTLKLLAYTWLALNVVLVLLTVSKNSMYVLHFGLTYKRIGVYTYLLLTAVGLGLSFIKIAQVKNNWFLFRKNAWSVYVVLLLLSSYNWDKAITYFNIHVARTTDYQYLSRLSDVNLPELLQASDNEKGLFSEVKQQHLQFRKLYFLERVSKQNWQSWSYSDWRLKQRLERLE